MDHYMASCIKEIAFEGLDGITLSTLWNRLTDVHLDFPIAMDENGKEFIWNAILERHDIEMFLLPTERLPEEPISLEDTLDHTSGYFRVPVSQFFFDPWHRNG